MLGKRPDVAIVQLKTGYRQRLVVLGKTRVPIPRNSRLKNIET